MTAQVTSSPGSVVASGGGKSFLSNGVPPSAILSNGNVIVPLYAVSSISLSRSYRTAKPSDSPEKTDLGLDQDSIELSGLLVGDERFAFKFLLEVLADASWRGPLFGGLLPNLPGGLVLITSLAVRTDLQIGSLRFNVSAARRDVIEVSMGLTYMPKAGSTTRLLDVATLAVASLADFGVR